MGQKQHSPIYFPFFAFVICGMSFLSLYAMPGNQNGNAVHPVNPQPIAEYDTVAGVVMYWNPGNNQNYDQIVVAVADGIQSHATVFMQTNGDNHRQHMISTFQNHGVSLDQIVFIDVYGDRIWIRDHGPLSIFDNDSLAFVGFDDFAANHGDKDLPERLATYWGINYYDLSHIVFDGGNYMVDSHNRLFATNRIYTNNPGVQQEEIDEIFNTYMGIEHIFVFLPMTNDYWGHLDMQIKLLNDTTFIISTVDTWHEDYLVLQDNYNILQSIQHPEGKTYQIVQIPKAQNWKTYINSLIVNSAVLVPVYDDPLDEHALQIYRELMPGKEVIGINCNAMIHWEGAIHCITKQIPPFTAPEADDNGDDGEDDDNGDETGFDTVQDSHSSNPLSVYPNPAFNNAIIAFAIEMPGSYTLKITDSSGCIVRSTQITAWTSGRYSMAMDATNLDAGVYIISLRHATGQWSTKLIIQ